MRFSTRMLRTYNTLPLWLRILIESLSVALPFYFAALLSAQVQQLVQLGSVQFVLLNAGIVIFLTTAIVFIIRLLRALQENLKLLERARLEALSHAYSLTDRYLTESLIAFRDGVQAFTRTGDQLMLVKTLIASEMQIRSLVEKLYLVVEAHFGNEGNLDARVDFEVTFMTKSYRDDKITIPAWANRDNRAPRSMLFRENDPDIYDTTVTAQVYREARPTHVIVEDTSETKYHYAELYPDQKSRIRSSIIYPVLSEANQLLGTLVLHCDRPKFFLYEDRRYWKELIEIFAKRIALEKTKLDLLQSHLQGRSITLAQEPPF